MERRDCVKGATGPLTDKPLLADSLASEIVGCKKAIPAGTRDPHDLGALKLDSGNYRRRIPLKCDGYNLRMTIRKSEDDPFDFSVILTYVDASGRTYIIRRYNGDHGEHRDQMTGRIISGPHIHKISEEYQRMGYKAEGFAEATEEYRTLKEAISIFLRDMHIAYELPRGATTLDDYHD
jgi:hypothetical protein